MLLFAITLSYQQIIHAYPSGGGAYVVATTNWGQPAGLVAGGSLLVDYMLTVAVSVTSGTDAIVSAIPALRTHTVGISIIIVILVMGLNLRGLRESASFLTIPVYLFIVMIIAMIGWGFFEIVTGQITYHAAAPIGAPVQGMTLVLFLRAFSSGSSSLTGVEAISNAVPNFHKPKSHNASATLAIMAAILGVFFGGITFLSYYLGIRPMADNTVLSQIAAAVFGHGLIYYILQLATAMILQLRQIPVFQPFQFWLTTLQRINFCHTPI